MSINEEDICIENRTLQREVERGTMLSCKLFAKNLYSMEFNVCDSKTIKRLLLFSKVKVCQIYCNNGYLKMTENKKFIAIILIIL